MLERVFLVDYEKDNLTRLSSLFKDLYNIFPSIYSGNMSSLYEFILQDEDGVIFVRIDDTIINGLEITKKSSIWYPRIQVVWMSNSESYALDAFPHGIDAYLVLPANRENILQVVESLQFKKKRYAKSC